MEIELLSVQAVLSASGGKYPTFPEDGGYRYYTIKGQETGVVMTSQYTYVYYYI